MPSLTCIDGRFGADPICICFSPLLLVENSILAHLHLHAGVLEAGVNERFRLCRGLPARFTRSKGVKEKSAHALAPRYRRWIPSFSRTELKLMRRPGPMALCTVIAAPITDSTSWSRDCGIFTSFAPLLIVKPQCLPCREVSHFAWQLAQQVGQHHVRAEALGFRLEVEDQAVAHRRQHDRRDVREGHVVALGT